MRRVHMNRVMDEKALMDACHELASKTMFNSEPEPSGIRAVAEKFFNIAREHSGFVPESEDRKISLCVRYATSLRFMHFPIRETTPGGSIRLLTVLLELAHPSEIPGPDGEPFFTDIEGGICRARSRFT